MNNNIWLDGVSERSQRVGLWCGVAFYILFFGACWPMAGFIPPPEPGWTGEELISRYRDNIAWIRAAMPVGLISGVLLVPWSTVLAIQVARLERGIPFWAITCVAAGAVNSVAFFLPFIFWSGAFYRLDRTPELILLINDMTWLEFVMVWPPVFLQMLSVAIAGLTHEGHKQVFPRWYYYLCAWCAALLIPGSLIIFFFRGPFAWNGLLAFWLPLTAYTIYILTSFVLVHRAIKNHAAEHALESTRSR
ncbi:MAG: hypothetical protein ABW318_00240 [Vicinamibacterales bacterium]